ncbi:tail fiber domain-containing protein [Peredibacter sp. HCB2-198]|uniref:tail fiber domain-containing protein n=1 Tax=Peredibacter sp. HCB2-198 TaxID=3383025 RepID=UPI0038B63456
MTKLSLFIGLFLSLSLSSAFGVDTFGYSGRLVKVDGSPVQGPVTLKLDLAYTDSGTGVGPVLCSKDISGVTLTNGVFHLKIAYTSAECGGNPISKILVDVPSGETIAIRITDVTDSGNPKAYSFQAVHALPYAGVSLMARDLVQMGASPGHALVWNGSKWAPSNVGTGNGTITQINTIEGIEGGPISTVGTIKLVDGGVTNVKLASGIDPAKLSGTRDATKFLRGDNTWATLLNEVMNSLLTGVTTTNSPINATDSLLVGMGKLQGQINGLSSGKLDKTGGTLSIGTIDGVPDPVSDNQVANKNYVDDKIANYVLKAGDTMTGNLNLEARLRFKSTTANYVELKAPSGLGTTFTLNLPPSIGTSGQLLTSDGLGGMSWTNPAAGASGPAGGDLSGTYPNPSISGLSATKIAGGAVDNTEFGYLDGLSGNIQSQLNTKTTITNGTTSQYFRGDMSWQDLGTAVRGTTLTGHASTTGTITAADSILSAIGKLNGNQASYLPLSGGTLTGGLNMSGTMITGLGSPSLASDAVNKTYVDSRLVWATSGTNVYYNGGNVGIGTAAPAQKLEVVGTIRTTDVIYTSDKNEKKNIRTLNGEETIRKILAIRPVSYQWKNNGGPDMGVIAQELKAIYPDLVIKNTDGKYSVRYHSLIAPLIGSVQELHAENAELKARMEELERKMNELVKRK